MANNVGVRDYLRGLGVDNERIGWNQADGYVTLDGQYFMKPVSVVDGRSYADADAIKNAYLSLQTNRVGGAVANPYQGKADGIIAQVQGSSYKPTYTAPVYQQTAVYQPAAPYAPKYTGEVEGLLSDIKDAKFSYDVEKDPSWQVYRDKFAREGDAAMNEAIAATAANTGGVLSSYGAAAANQARAAYAKKAADIIPTLEQQAYSRWDADQSRNMGLAQLYQSLENDNRAIYESDRNFDRGVYESDRDFERANYESDRSFDRGVYESDRNFERANYESDRDFSRNVYESDRDQWNAEQERQLDIAGMYADLDSEYYNRDYNERVLGYEQTRDAVADAQWEKEFALQQQAQAARASGGSRGSGSGKGSTAEVTPEQAWYYQNLYYQYMESPNYNAYEAMQDWQKHRSGYAEMLGEDLAKQLEEEITNRLLSQSGGQGVEEAVDPDDAYYAALSGVRTGKTTLADLRNNSTSLSGLMGWENYAKLVEVASDLEQEAGKASEKKQEQAKIAELQSAINDAGEGKYTLEQVEKEASYLIEAYDYEGYKKIFNAAKDYAENDGLSFD